MAYKTEIPCVCIPSAGFTCQACAARKEAGPEDFTLESDTIKQPSNNEQTTDLTGYGYHSADQDGFDGGYVTAEEHKEEEFFRAAEMALEANPI